MRPAAKIWGLTVALVSAAIGGTLLLLTAGYTALQTDFGRRAVAAFVENTLADPGFGVEIEALDSLSLSGMRLGAVRLHDARGVWLTIEDIDAAWRPEGFLAGRVAIESLTANRVRVERVPDSPSKDTDDTGGFRPPLAVALGHLAVNRLELDGAVLGTAAVLALSGSAAVHAEGTGDFRLDVERLDGTKGRVSAHASFDLGTEALDIGLSANEPEGGLLVQLLGIPDHPALGVDLVGEGTLRDWRGTLRADAKNAVTLKAETALAFDGERLTAEIDGTIDAVKLIPPAAVPLLGKEIAYALRLNWGPEKNSLDIAPSLLTAAALDVAFSGSIDLNAMVPKIQGRIGIRDAAAVSSVLTPGAIRDADAAISLQGADLAVTVDASGVTFGEPAVNVVVGPTPSANIRARITPNGGIDILAMRLDLAVGSVSGSGSIDPTTARGDVAMVAEAIDLGVLSTALGAPITGRGAVTLLVRGDAASLSGTVSTSVEAWSWPGGPPDLAGIVPRAALALDFTGGRETGWRFSDIALDADGLRLTGTVELSADMDTIDAGYQFEATNLAVLSKAAGIGLSGQAKASGTVTGTFARPRGRLDLTISESPWGTIAAGTFWALTAPNRLELRDVEARALAASGTGDVVLDPNTGGVDGTLKVTAADLAAVSAYFGVDLHGPATANLGLFSDQGRQGAAFGLGTAELRMKLGSDTFQVARVEATGTVRDVFGAPRLEADIKAAHPSVGGVAADRVMIHADGLPSELRFNASANGSGDTPFDLNAAGMIVSRGETIRLRLDRTEARGLGTSVRLASPLQATIGAGTIAVEDLDLVVDGGRVTAAFRLDETAVALQGRIKALPIHALRALLPEAAPTGHIDGDIRLTGTPEAPEGRFRLATSQAEIGIAERRLALAGILSGQLQGGMLKLEGNLDAVDGVSTSVTASLPLRFTLHPFAFGPPANADLRIAAHGKGDLGAAWAAFGFDPHRVDGAVAFDMVIDGTTANPRPKGTMRIDGGRYENFDTGTLIEDLSVEAQLSEGILRIAHGGGRAGQGRIAVEGSVQGLMELSPRFDIHLRAEKAELLARDDVTVNASADLRFSGDFLQAALKGRVTTELVEIRLVEMGGADVVQLDVVEINRGDGAAEVLPPQAASKNGGFDPEFAVELGIPRRFFVRGRGLDSEWSGGFTLSGRASKPQLSGRLTPVRGEFSFAGKAFVFKEGMIDLHGEGGLVPVLDLVAEHKVRDLTARIRVHGSADDPKIALSSIPDLPQDEILSRVLFDRGVSSISAIEAAQLADAVAILSGRGGGGILDTARKMLGVDVLRVEGGEGGAPGVTAGTYVGEGVFVGVNQGTDPKGGEARVEVEVTPNISVETDIGPNTSGRVGARWSLDY